MAFGNHVFRRRAWPILALALGGLAASSVGCESEEARQTPGEEQPPRETLSDAQIVRVVSVIDTGEIEQAQIALPRLQDTDARAYAQRMIDEHTATETRLTTLTEQKNITPADSALARQLKQNGEAKAQVLRDPEIAADEYDAKYLDTQIVMHRSALDVIDRQLVPQVKDKDLAAFLADTRAHVQTHLKEAQQLRTRVGPTEAP
jgi:putative membrane protein